MVSPETTWNILPVSASLIEDIAEKTDQIAPDVAEHFSWECAVWALQQERATGRPIPPPLWSALEAARMVLEGRLPSSDLARHRGEALGLCGDLPPEQAMTPLRRSLCWIVAYVCSVPEDHFWRQQNLRRILDHLASLLMHWPNADALWAGRRLQSLQIAQQNIRERLCLLLLARGQKLDAFAPLVRDVLEEGLFG